MKLVNSEKYFFKGTFFRVFSGLVTKNPEKGQTVSKYDFLSKYFILTEKHSCLFSFLSAICLQFVSYLFTISQLFVYISSAIYYISSAVCLHFISCLFTFHQLFVYFFQVLNFWTKNEFCNSVWGISVTKYWWSSVTVSAKKSERRRKEKRKFLSTITIFI